MLPFYNKADKWQNEERDIQNRMKKKLADIRAVFKGDERQMIIHTYYRQIGYNPLLSVRSTVGLLLQIPFFIAAYNFLSHASYLSGASFYFLKDLGKPDQILSVAGFTINVMPIVMTALNLASVFIYTKNLQIREKVQLCAMAGVFLLLLYNSPSGLVLYWTCSNLFSLCKNSSKYLKNPGSVLWGIILLALSSLFVFLLLNFDKFNAKYLLAVLFVNIFLIVIILGRKIIGKIIINSTSLISDEKESKKIFYYSCLILFLLAGLVIPSFLVVSSPLEFENAISMLLRTVFQAGALFLLIPFLIRAFTASQYKELLTFLIVFFIGAAGLSCFAFTANYGVITTGFTFERWESADKRYDLYKTIVAVIIPFFFTYIIFKCKQIKLLKNILSVLIISSILTAGINYYNIIDKIWEQKRITASNSSDLTSENLKSVFKFSKTGKNVFVLFLDRAPGFMFPTAIAEYPELAKIFNSFVFYPNTVSFGSNTLFSSSAMFGGYEYRALQLNERENDSLKTKVNEALFVLPKILGESEYSVTVTDPTYANLSWIPDISIYDGMENVTAYKITGIFRSRFSNEYGESVEGFSNIFDYDLCTRFSIFRMLPPLARSAFYYDGNWLKKPGSPNYNEALKHYPNLFYLSDLCSITDEENAFNLMMNESTHTSGGIYNKELVLTQEPVIISDRDIDKYGSSDNAKFLFTYAASLKALDKWFSWLKKENIYDNTKIVIISDHGWWGEGLDGSDIGIAKNYNPILLIKDFDSTGNLKTSDQFMTNADLPAIVLDNLDINNVNPYTGNKITTEEKNNPIFIYNGSWFVDKHTENKLKIESVYELKNQNIFDEENWEEQK